MAVTLEGNSLILDSFSLYKTFSYERQILKIKGKILGSLFSSVILRYQVRLKFSDAFSTLGFQPCMYKTFAKYALNYSISIFLETQVSCVVIRSTETSPMRRERKRQLILWSFYAIRKNTCKNCKELEPSLLSSQLYSFCICIAGKGVLSWLCQWPDWRVLRHSGFYIAIVFGFSE